jgi:hypothetical protein
MNTDLAPGLPQSLPRRPRMTIADFHERTKMVKRSNRERFKQQVTKLLDELEISPDNKKVLIASKVQRKLLLFVKNNSSKLEIISLAKWAISDIDLGEQEDGDQPAPPVNAQTAVNPPNKKPSASKGKPDPQS